MRPDLPSLPEHGMAVLRCSELREKVALELDRLQQDMEELGVQLCLDEEVMLRCMKHLQRLDELGQRSFWLAAMIRAADPATVVPDITLQTLKDRMEG